MKEERFNTENRTNTKRASLLNHGLTIASKRRNGDL